MSAYAVVGMVPIEEGARRIDFASKEVETIDEALEAIREFAERPGGWRMIHLLHIEDLPLMMEGPEGTTGTTGGPPA